MLDTKAHIDKCKNGLVRSILPICPNNSKITTPSMYMGIQIIDDKMAAINQFVVISNSTEKKAGPIIIYNKKSIKKIAITNYFNT